jgi:hypothetical protein
LERTIVIKRSSLSLLKNGVKSETKISLHDQILLLIFTKHFISLRFSKTNGFKKTPIFIRRRERERKREKERERERKSEAVEGGIEESIEGGKG